MLFMNYIWLAIGGVFLFSVIIVLLVSWLMGRSGSRRRVGEKRREGSEELLNTPPQPPPVSRGGVEKSFPHGTGMESDLVKEILSSQVPDSKVEKESRRGGREEESAESMEEDEEELLADEGPGSQEESYLEDLESFLSMEEKESKTLDEEISSEEEPVDEGDLSFLYDEEAEVGEEDAVGNDEDELPSHRPDCFGREEVYLKCSKSCGLGEECRKKVEGGS